MKKQNKGCSNGKLATNDSTTKRAKRFLSCTFFIIALSLAACQREDGNGDDHASPSMRAVYVLNEGNYMASNATLTRYEPQTKNVIADIFYAANGAAFGDSPTSMSLFEGRAFICISGSGKIYILDPATGRLTGKITGLNSPRHIEFITAEKAYVSNLWSNVIDIVNPRTEQKIGSIDIGAGNCAERFVRNGAYVYTNCWSYGTKILKIDTSTDRVVGELEVGVQPMTLLADARGKMWTITDGGWEGNTTGYEDPAIHSIDIATFSLEQSLPMKRAAAGGMFSAAMTADAMNLLYVTGGKVFRMPVTQTSLPLVPFINGEGANLYSIGVNPRGGDIYLGDAVDFAQSGNVLRFNSEGRKIDAFKAGVSPGAFGFVQ